MPLCNSFYRTVLLGSVGVMLMPFLSGCLSPQQSTTFTPQPALVIEKVAGQMRAADPPATAYDPATCLRMTAMLQAGETLEESTYINHVRIWADRRRQDEISGLVQTSQPAGVMPAGIHWAMARPLLMLFKQTGDPDYLADAIRMAEAIANKSSRSSDHTILYQRNPEQISAETLLTICPALSSVSNTARDTYFLEVAARQLLLHSRHLQDESTGWFAPESCHEVNPAATEDSQCTPRTWDSACAFAAFVEVMQHVSPDSSGYDQLHEPFARLLECLLKAQDPMTYLWRCEIDDPNSRIDVTSSLLILTSLMRGKEYGLFSIADDQPLARAWTAAVASAFQSPIFDENAESISESVRYDQGQMHDAVDAFLLMTASAAHSNQ